MLCLNTEIRYHTTHIWRFSFINTLLSTHSSTFFFLHVSQHEFQNHDFSIPYYTVPLDVSFKIMIFRLQYYTSHIWRFSFSHTLLSTPSLTLQFSSCLSAWITESWFFNSIIHSASSTSIRMFEHKYLISHEPGKNILIYWHALVYYLLNFAIFIIPLDLTFKIMIFQFHIIASDVSFDSGIWTQNSDITRARYEHFHLLKGSPQLTTQIW